MKKINLAAFAISMVCAASVQANALNAEGMSGLLLINTADTVAVDKSFLSVSGGIDSYRIPNSSARAMDVFMTPSLTYGVTPNLEFSLRAQPVVLFDSSDFGIRDLSLAAKFRFSGDRAQGYGVALAAFGSMFKADVTRNIGTADSNYGAELIFSRLGSSSGLHASFGSKVDDVRMPGATPAYKAAAMLTANAGLDVMVVPGVRFSFEALFSRQTKTGDNNLLIMPGIHLRGNDSLSYMFGMAYGVPADRSDPETRYLASISLALDEPDEPYRSTTDRLGDLEQRMADMQSQEAAAPAESAVMDVRMAEMMAMQQQLHDQILDLQSQIDDYAGGLASNAIRVKIINASGVDRLGKLVGKTLRKRGYRIVSVSDIRQTVTKSSQIFYQGGASKSAEVMRIAEASLAIERVTAIYYRKGFDAAAIEVGHILPKNQMVLRDKKSSELVDLKIVVGRDMKILLMTGLKR